MSLVKSFRQRKKSAIEAALNELRKAHKMQDMAMIDTAMEKINAAWQAASQEMYQASQESESASGTSTGANQEEAVSDVEFEEVK